MTRVHFFRVEVYTCSMYGRQHIHTNAHRVEFGKHRPKQYRSGIRMGNLFSIFSTDGVHHRTRHFISQVLLFLLICGVRKCVQWRSVVQYQVSDLMVSVNIIELWEVIQSATTYFFDYCLRHWSHLCFQTTLKVISRSSKEFLVILYVSLHFW